MPCGVDDNVQVAACLAVTFHPDQALAEERNALLLADRIGRGQYLLRETQEMIGPVHRTRHHERLGDHGQGFGW